MTVLQETVTSMFGMRRKRNHPPAAVCTPQLLLTASLLVNAAEARQLLLPAAAERAIQLHHRLKLQRTDLRQAQLLSE